MHPAYIYAFERLGYLVTEENADRFTEAEQAAWDQAIRDWEAENPDEELPNGSSGAA